MRVRIPQWSTCIGSPRQRVRRAWRTRMRIKDWSSYWWGCISSRVKMRSNLLRITWSVDNLDLVQEIRYFYLAKMRSEYNGEIRIRHLVIGEDDFSSYRHQESGGIGPHARSPSLLFAREAEEASLGNVSHRSPYESKSSTDHSVATVAVDVLERIRRSTPASPNLVARFWRRASVGSRLVSQKVRSFDPAFEPSSMSSPRPRVDSCLHTIARPIGESVRTSVSVYASVDRNCLA